jgi:hypothetical protein
LQGNDETDPPSWVTGIKQKPNLVVRKPAARHLLTQVSKSSPSRSGNRNTVILPDVDIEADIHAINHGDAIVDKERATAWVNRRLWGFHTDRGTAYPIHGEGFVPLSQNVYSGLKKVAEYNGLDERAEAYLRRSPTLTEGECELVRLLWRIREQARTNQ